MDKEKKKDTLKALVDIVDGKMLAIASDDSSDRTGDSLTIDRWDLRSFKKNPVLQAGHDYRPEYTIGVAKHIKIKDNQLLFEPEFHDYTQLAREVGDMYRNGILKAFSVGFIPDALMSPDDKKAKNQLLEISAVAVPANANALMIEAKSYDDKTLNKVKDWVGKELDEKKEAKVIEDIEEKEGRVISKKNRNIIKEAVEALEKVLGMSETPEKVPEKGITAPVKVEEIKPELKKSIVVAPKKADDKTVQILKRIAGLSNLALNNQNKVIKK